MYYRVDEVNVSKTVKSRKIIVGTLMFTIATLCRSTGLLLSIYTIYYFAKKTVYRSDSFCAMYKYVFYFFSTIIIFLLPLGVVILWKPYLLHCETKLDRTDAVPKWCLTELPNVYSYVQYVYWDNEFMSILHRPIDTLLTSLPMNFIFLYIFLRFIRS
jgi:Gpi18-like mannosyltransferase